jgi:hypothetical protein
VRQGNFSFLDELAEVGDPRAGDLAVEVLADSRIDEWDAMSAVDTLRKLADPRFVAPLRRAYDRATIDQPRIGLLAALEACGAGDAHDLLRDVAREDPDELVREWAQRRLRHRGLR